MGAPSGTGYHASHHAPTDHGPSGFDPLRGRFIQCDRCDGHGIVTSWSFGVKEPDECPECCGSGRNWRYPSGLIAKHYGGPFIGRDSDGSGGAGVTGTGTTEGNSAARRDRPQPSEEQKGC